MQGLTPVLLLLLALPSFKAAAPGPYQERLTLPNPDELSRTA